MKEEGGAEVEFERSESIITMGSSSVLHQLSFPVLARCHHTLGAERPLPLGSHFYSTHLVPSGHQDGSYLDEADVLKQPRKTVSPGRPMSVVSGLVLSVCSSLMPPQHPRT